MIVAMIILIEIFGNFDDKDEKSSEKPTNIVRNGYWIMRMSTYIFVSIYIVSIYLWTGNVKANIGRCGGQYIYLRAAGVPHIERLMPPALSRIFVVEDHIPDKDKDKDKYDD